MRVRLPGILSGGWLVAAVLALAACGGVQAADLFVVTRMGGGPHGELSLLVNEEGGVSCNGGPVRQLSDPQIVQARGIQEELHDAASAGLRLAPRPGSVYSYEIRDETGTVRYADNSSGRPHVLDELSLFVEQVAQQVCKLPE